MSVALEKSKLERALARLGARAEGIVSNVLYELTAVGHAQDRLFVLHFVLGLVHLVLIIYFAMVAVSKAPYGNFLHNAGGLMMGVHEWCLLAVIAAKLARHPFENTPFPAALSLALHVIALVKSMTVGIAVVSAYMRCVTDPDGIARAYPDMVCQAADDVLSCTQGTAYARHCPLSDRGHMLGFLVTVLTSMLVNVVYTGFEIVYLQKHYERAMEKAATLEHMADGHRAKHEAVEDKQAADAQAALVADTTSARLGTMAVDY